MKGLLKFLLKTAKILCYVILVLFVVYFWNMDQKLMAWLLLVCLCLTLCSCDLSDWVGGTREPDRITPTPAPVEKEDIIDLDIGHESVKRVGTASDSSMASEPTEVIFHSPLRSIFPPQDTAMTVMAEINIKLIIRFIEVL